jgi:hypothetical protein
MTSSSSSNFFRGLHLSSSRKDGSRKEKDPGCKVDEAGQSTEALWWPLGYADLCVVVVKKHFCHIFRGRNPPETLLQFFQSFHIDIRVDRLATGQHVYENDLRKMCCITFWVSHVSMTGMMEWSRCSCYFLVICCLLTFWFKLTVFRCVCRHTILFSKYTHFTSALFLEAYYLLIQNSN